MKNVAFRAKLRIHTYILCAGLFLPILILSSFQRLLPTGDREGLHHTFEDMPTIDCPATVLVSCLNFDPSLSAHGKASPGKNVCVDTTKIYQGVKGISHRADYSAFDTTCNRGTIVRTFTVHDCTGETASCTQMVIVFYEENYYVKFPDDRIVTTCVAGNPNQYGAPVFFGEDCELLATSFLDDTLKIVPDACFRVDRHWKVINWCTYDPACGLTSIPNPAPNVLVNHPNNLIGPVVSDRCNALSSDPWRATRSKINPTDTAETNFCTFWRRPDACSPKFNGYQYTQIIKVIDGKPPVLQCTKPDTCDLTDNDPLFWNLDYWWDATHSSHDLAEIPIDLKLAATDLCSGPNITFQYLLFLDLDGNGTMETVINSAQLPEKNTVYYGNALLANYQGGTPRAFDHRSVVNPTLDSYRFAMQVTRSGANATAAVRFNTQRDPNTYVLPQLPHGKHRIRWIVEDGCGNETRCEYPFEIKDCKKPTVVCKPLSVNIMQNKMVSLWAMDFLEYAFDNCTPTNQLKFAVSKDEPAPAAFPRDPVTRLPITQVTFTCLDLGPNVIQLWAEDAQGNAEYCQVVLLVQDNMGNCLTSNTLASGYIKTETGDGVEDAWIKVTGTHPAFPPLIVKTIFTTFNGQYTISSSNALPGTYNICPEKDDNPLNGVTTLDLALINKHILGVQPFNSPYKLIAADGNKSGTITTFDVVEFRKLILGIYDELPNNQSWRFVAKSYVFPNPANPFQSAFPECISALDLSSNSADFVGIKIGDLNNSAISNNLTDGGEDRSLPEAPIVAEDRPLLPGDVFETSFHSENALIAQQFTLSFPELELLEIIPRAADLGPEHFARFPQKHQLTHAWNSDRPSGETPNFALRFRALAAGRLSDLLSLADAPTPSLAYAADADNKPLKPVLRFYKTPAETKEELVLFQNQPNPFSSATTIGFYLPKDDKVYLSVFDESGRILLQREAKGAKGYNRIDIGRETPLPKGTLYYKIQTSTDTATQKMLRI